MSATRPNQERHEFIADDILRLAQVPAHEILRIRPPNRRELFPPKFGYDQTAYTIHDVISTEEFTPTFRSWTTGASDLSYRRRRNDEPPSADPSLRNAFVGVGPSGA